jgi:hypothetical protein
VVLLWWTPPGVLALNAALFAAVLAAAAICPAPVIDLRDGVEHEIDDRAWWSGVEAIRSTAAIHAPILLVVAVNLLYGMAVVGVVLVGDQLTGGGHRGVGLLNGALGIGGLIGLLGTGALDRARRPLRALGLLTVVTGVALAGVGLVPSLGMAAGLLVVAGAGAVLAEVLALTAVQRAVPHAEIARVFGILDALLVGAICLGSLVTPPLVRTIGLAPALAALGLAIPLAGLSIAVLLRPALRTTNVALAGANA